MGDAEQGRRSGGSRSKGNLPPEATSFVGRGSELSTLTNLVTAADGRLVTLTGLGGVGKSRLARRAAAEARPAFPDGVWLVELSPLTEAEPLALAVYEALRLADQSTRPAAEVVAEWLADKRLLLILDCCEHLAAACADMAEALLAAGPGVRVLATSRSPLRARGERVVPVSPLPVSPLPSASALSAADRTYGGQGAPPADAAVLFAERAAEAAPGLVLTERDGPAVGEICARLEGIPLAIELAAARLPEMPLDELRRRLHAPFELLTMKGDGRGTYGRYGEGETRHQTLRTTIGWSHELCTAPERLLWARLSVFAGGFEQEAAQWVCAGGPLGSREVPGLLDRLVDQSVLRRADTPASGSAPLEARKPRYSMLDTIREYGQDWLARTGGEERLRERHRDYYRWLARTGEREWVGPGQLIWYERLTAELANLRAALEGCLADADPLPALEMASDLWFFWTGCGYLREGRGYLERALAEDRAAPAGPELFRALWACGHVANMQGDFDVSAALESRSAPLAERLADPAAAGAVRYVRGTRLVMTGRPDQTLALCGREAATPPAHSHGTPLAVRLLTLGITSFAHLQSGEIPQAAAVAEAMREESEGHGDVWMRAYALYFQALAALAGGDPAAAVRHARDSLACKWQLHDTFGAAVSLDTLAASVAPTAPAQAARLLGAADQLWHSIGRDRAAVKEFLATRHTCEHTLRETVGDAPYETAHREGLETNIDDGIAHALTVA
ncbi:AAA family ATPase [Streptomyces sp. NPDC050617]|uniref:ATP-binding protein n=1 Tax=Streptomyces sp. NPDC050617 TaxID=3154628 RepID=UPI00341B2BB2